VNSSELLAAFRSELSDSSAPYMWSDTEVYSYIDDAEKMFCRETEGVSDATTVALTRLTIIPGSEWLSLSPLVLRIHTARRLDTGREVEIIDAKDMTARNWYFDGRTGPVRALVVGEEAKKARVWPISSETVTVALNVFRLPVNRIVGAAQSLEIDEHHHRHLLMWCKHLAYGKEDADTFDKSKSSDYEQRFYAYCRGAKAEQQRARYRPRTVQYGGL
jgi:hypothetical protein